MKKLILCLVLIISFFQSKSQVISIADAKTKPNGTTVTVRGIVTNGSELGTIRYLQDGTGGLSAYSTSMGNVQRGDSIEVTGVVAPYNNLFELTPVNSFSVITSGNPLPAPKVLTMAGGYVESYEGQLVRFNNTTFISTGNFQTASANYDATDGSLVSAQVRINSTSNIAGTPIPGDAIDLIGIMSQFQSTYQLLPRDLNDFVLQGNPPVFTTTLFQQNITANSFDVSFSTQNPGNTILYYGTTTSLGSTVSNGTLTTNHSLGISGLNAGTLYYVKAATVSSSGDTSFSSPTPMMTQSLSSGIITCYFTRNVDNTVAQGVNAKSLPQLMDDTLIAYMNRAKYSLDVAIYNMDNNNGIVDAINAAYNRGVTVRVIGDGANMDGNAWSQVNVGTNNKKLSPTTSTYGIMHNKFLAIDANSADPNDAVVWTGSMNFTNQQISSDANNVIIFRDQSLAKAYEMEFEEMWSGLFGPDKSNNTPKEFNIGGNRVELYFSPSDDTESEIKRTAETADHDLEFCVYSFTRITITYSIDDRTSQGVWGGGVIDDTANLSFGYSILTSDMPNRMFVANHSYLVHNKYLIVDANAPGLDPTVLTGSHNWTNSAQTRNDENTVVVHNASIANQYYQEWVSRYKDEGGTELPSYVVGLNELENENASLTIFPNPASDQIYFVMTGENISPATIQLWDITGRMITEILLEKNSSINVSKLPAGIYAIRVIQDGKVFQQKLIVAN